MAEARHAKVDPTGADAGSARPHDAESHPTKTPEAPKAEVGQDMSGRNTFPTPPPWLSGWLPILISLISLGLSLFNFYQSNRLPDVSITIPPQVRVSQGPQKRQAMITMQPAFYDVSTGDRVAAILNMWLEVRPSSRGPSVRFSWLAVDKIELLASRPGGPANTNVIYVADPSPFVISRSTPQLPLVTFAGPRDWYFRPGIYRVTLVAKGAPSEIQLSKAFKLVFRRTLIADMNRWGSYHQFDLQTQL